MSGKKAKERQGFEASPPLCRNCDWFANAGTHQVVAKPKHSPQRCTLGNFNTTAFSVCDKWTCKGEVIAN